MRSQRLWPKPLRQEGMHLWHVLFGYFDTRFKTSCRENSYGEPGKTPNNRQGCPRGCQEANPLLGAPWVRVWPTKMWAFVFLLSGGETHFGSKLDKNESCVPGIKASLYPVASSRYCWKLVAKFSSSAEPYKLRFLSDSLIQFGFAPREKDKIQHHVSSSRLELTAPKGKQHAWNHGEPAGLSWQLSELLFTNSAPQYCL